MEPTSGFEKSLLVVHFFKLVPGAGLQTFYVISLFQKYQEATLSLLMLWVQVHIMLEPTLNISCIDAHADAPATFWFFSQHD